jgi:hypothetical protein
LAFSLCFISTSLAIMAQTPILCQGCTYPGCQVVVTKFCTTASNIFFILAYVTFWVPGILRWLLDLCEVRAPMPEGLTKTVVHNSKHTYIDI